MNETATDWLVFRLGEQRWALAAGGIRQVMRMPPLACVPGACPSCLGVIAWQGRPVTVLDAARWLVQGTAREAQQERLVIWAQDGHALGLRVDAVLGLRRVPPSAVLPLQAALPPPWNAVSGLLRQGDDIDPILEPAALLAAGGGAEP